MRALLKITGLFFFIALLSVKAQAASFVVQKIQIDGLQGVSRDTVLSYLSVHTGQQFDTAQTGEVIRTLYGTGFFSNIQVAQQGNTLLITVVERPVIGSFTVTGNQDIPKDKLNEVLKQQGLVQGRVLDHSVLERVKSSLQNEYDVMGKYTATVTTSVTPLSHNRVAVKIDISEGRTVQVKGIRIIGSKAFKSDVLIDEMTLTTPKLWTFFTRTDQYSQEKFNASLDAVRFYYLDRGYLKFKINSAQATLTPDRKYVYIVLHVTEGPIYKFKDYHLRGNLILSETKLAGLIKVKPGNLFSRQDVVDSTDAINKAMGNMGYAFSNVNAVPDVDEQSKQVSVTFYVDPGQRVYVRRINFTGNIKTKDVVLRRVLPQLEGSIVSTDDIKESERQLNLTGYFDKVNVATTPVPGVSDQVDLNYNVTEAPAAQATVGFGYGTDGWLINAGLNQNNFLGTGNSLGFNFNTGKIFTSYSINYNNPYYTLDGISRGFSVYMQRNSPSNLDVTNYTTDAFGGAVNYSIPISARGDNLQLGLGYQGLLLHVGGGVSTQVQNFINSNGRRFNQIYLNTGWTRNGLDRAIFPMKGLHQDAGVQMYLPAGGEESKMLTYYKANYNLQFYQPLFSESFILTARGAFGYGNGLGNTNGLPFFANYYAGGIGFTGQVRGYEANSLGPQDSNNRSLGGNILTTGSLGIIFPNFVSPDKLRTAVFVDAGNVRSTLPSYLSGTPAGPIRYSAGISVDWRVPVLNVLLDLSLAKALNPQRGDQTNPFQFNLGTSF